MFENYFDPDDDYEDDGYDEDNGFGDDGDDDDDDDGYDDYGDDGGDDGGNGGGKSDKGADNDESGYGDDTGDGFGEETREKTIEEDIADKNKEQESEFTKDKNSDRWDGDLNSRSNNLSRQVEEKAEEIKVGLKANNSPKGKAAEEKLAKKNATRWSSLLGIPVGIRAVGTCPGCGKKTIYQSMTAIDLIIFKAILSLTKSPLNVYFCMNSGKNCRLSFEKGMCWMCAGKFEPTTMPVPYPLKLFRFNK